MRRLCVYCGSSTGDRPEYVTAAKRVGELLVRRGIGLVYGGGSVGLMGVVADAVLAGAGEAIGVIPTGLRSRELAHTGVTQMIEVESMHARKQRMVDLSDAFIALPGGIGTLDELFETWTWLQLGIHRKPIGLLDVAGYYGPLIGFLGRMRDERFIKPAHLDCLLVDTEAERLVDRLAAFRPPDEGKWIKREPGLEA
ncbi:MAG TPA: TIGR00730 family Rossman fold protein [Burkholderiales bacterium]|nr:TIGR00730 family Rossman fold protein [Burkholderiales bacterium]